VHEDEIYFTFVGIGLALVSPGNIQDYREKTYIFEEVYVNGKLTEQVKTFMSAVVVSYILAAPEVFQ